MKNFKNIILVDKSAVKEILESINIKVDKDGFLVKNEEKVFSNLGKPVLLEEYAGHKIENEKTIIYTKNLASLMSIETK